MEKKKAIGTRGSWYAVVDGETLPCVHKFWWKSGLLYNDTDMEYSPKANEIHQAIKKLERVILTDSITRFDKDGNVAFFRPGINQSGFHGISDTGWGSALDGNLDAEQAYRRGYAHGFDEAKCLVRENNLKQIERRGHEINRWRFARVWYGRTQPGTFDDWMPEIKSYRSISPKRRFDVLERDGRRCVVCGDDAKSGAVLEVDHIVSVANGGSDDLENLQTLCWACNSGKGAR